MIIKRNRKRDGGASYQVRIEYRGRNYCETYWNREDAARAERELRRRLQTSHLPVDPARVTFAQCLELWQEGRLGKLAPSTNARYRSLVDRFIIPVFGRYRVCDMSARVVRAELEVLQKRNGWSDGSVNKFATVLQSVLSYAYREELIQVNPLAGRFGRKTGRAFYRKAPDPEEVRAILVALQKLSIDQPDKNWLFMATLFASLSLRLGEVFGLQRCDYNAVEGTLCVARSFCAVTSQVKGTKTGRSRILQLPQPVCALIDNYLARVPSESAFFFPSPIDNKKPRHSNMAGKVLRSCFRECGVETDVHSLRHFLASSIPAIGGEAVEAMTITGHADLKAFQGYFHPRAKRQRELLERHVQTYLPDVLLGPRAMHQPLAALSRPEESPSWEGVSPSAIGVRAES